MNNTPDKNRFKSLLPEILFVLCLAFYTAYFNPDIYIYRTVNSIGYTDEMGQIRAFDELIAGKTPYKDFYYHYGPLYLYAQLPMYILLGKNHNALFIIWCRILPFLSICLAYLWSLIIFRSRFFRLFFILVCVIHNAVNFNFSIRQLTGCLALGIFILSLRHSNKRILPFLTGAGIAIALLTSQEFGITVLVTVLACLILKLRDREFSVLKYTSLLFAGLLATLSPFYLYLAIQGALGNYAKYVYGMTAHFSSPAQHELLPTLPSLAFNNIFSFFKSAISFILSRNLRTYLPPIIYFGGFIYFVNSYFRLKNKSSIEIAAISIFGLILYVRFLAGPAFSYIYYIIIPAITLAVLLIQWLQNKIYKMLSNDLKITKKTFVFCLVLLCFYLWIFATAENKSIFNLSTDLKMKKAETDYKAANVYFNKAGIYVPAYAKEQFETVCAYIESHTQPHEFIYIYPWGPYNHFTKRRDPLTARDTYDFMAGENFIDEAVEQLDAKKPKYVVLNLFNNLGIVSIEDRRGDVGDYISWGTEDSPCFIGRGDKLQKYILENYELEKQFDYAAILRRRQIKNEFTRRFFAVENWKPGSKEVQATELSGLKLIKQTRGFKITNDNATMKFRLRRPIFCSHVEIKLNLKAKYYKYPFSKNLIVMTPLFNDRVCAMQQTMYDLMSFGQSRTVLIGFSGNMAVFINGLKIAINTPKPYIKPDELEIESISFMLEAGSRLEDHLPEKKKPLSKEDLQNQAKPAPVPVPLITEETIKKLNLDDKIIASTFKTLSKAFVLASNIGVLKKNGIKKVQKMSDSKFDKRYQAVYPFIKDLPDEIKQKYGVTEHMTRKQAIANLESLNKMVMFGLIDSVPDLLIATHFKNYIKKTQTSISNSSLIQEIAKIWSKSVVNKANFDKN